MLDIERDNQEVSEVEYANPFFNKIQKSKGEL